ncbi:MAG: hypothetical protein ACRDTE_07855, partial [Pseudonocardiaceae bacterium]
ADAPPTTQQDQHDTPVPRSRHHPTRRGRTRHRTTQPKVQKSSDHRVAAGEELCGEGVLHDTGRSSFIVSGAPVTDVEALSQMDIPGHETCVEVVPKAKKG